MSRSVFPLSLIAVLMGGAAGADVPRVAVDIAPVHSLVARVMAGVGEPSLIVPPGASPHEYTLRPSEAAALQEADVVFWVGAGLTPWMGGAIETLAGDAAVTALLDAERVELLDFREGALFEAHSHDHGELASEDAKDAVDDTHVHEDAHEHEHEHEHEHDGGEAAGASDRGVSAGTAHEHEESAAHDHDAEQISGADDHDHDHDHGHDTHDPHAWLSPHNAEIWLDVIASQLSAADPGNADAYAANAADARNELEALSSEVKAILEPARGLRFVVFHDAYQYFEAAFDFPARGAISLSDATDPSPARIAEIRRRVADENIDCVLSEPQFNPGLVASVMDGVESNTAVLDPLGSNLAPGPDLYPQLLRNLASSLAGCRQD